MTSYSFDKSRCGSFFVTQRCLPHIVVKETFRCHRGRESGGSGVHTQRDLRKRITRIHNEFYSFISSMLVFKNAPETFGMCSFFTATAMHQKGWCITIAIFTLILKFPFPYFLCRRLCPVPKQHACKCACMCRLCTRKCDMRVCVSI